MSETAREMSESSPLVSIGEEGGLGGEYFEGFDFDTLDTSLEALLKAGVHFGHLKSRRHPKMDEFIFTTRKNISVINLEKTVESLAKAIHFLQGIQKSGKPILFVGIKKQAQDAVRSLAKRLSMPFVVDRWLGGTLTNFSFIRGRARYLSDTKAKFAQGEFKKYTKLERQKIAEELEKLERKVGGIQGMNDLPGAIFIADIKEATLVVREAQKMHIPLVGIVDTNADPSVIDYPIPGNDDALSSLRLILGAVGQALLEGKEEREKAPQEEKQ